MAPFIAHLNVGPQVPTQEPPQAPSICCMDASEKSGMNCCFPPPHFCGLSKQDRDCGNAHTRGVQIAVNVGCLDMSGLRLSRFWVAVKELKLSYYIGETLLLTIYTHYGNLI